ncbi:MarR family winged helix-turn-helix transcriptional regulator [Janthinobacterium sp. HLX7-2]|uniref:MarR family winged helix-turn-helix transcriptional regulator n=1 Tax=Janthinobacterium sp. HLX7-2 TaxID=1259331 RepID=UPI003F208888
MPPDEDLPIPERALALSDELRTALKRLMRCMQREGGEMDAHVSMMQYLLLALIHEQPGIGVAALARLQNVRGPTVSAQVKSLEQAGLVERSAPDLQDRRRSGLQLSAQGLSILDTLRARRRDALARRIAHLSPQQMDALAAAMQPLLEIAQA